MKEKKKTTKRVHGRKKPSEKKHRGRPIIWTDEKIEEERLSLVEWFNNGKKNYSITKFAHSRGYGRAQLMEFCEISKCFSDSYKLCKEICEDRVLEYSFENKMNPMFGIFTLKCNYGWIEKAEREKIQLRRDEIKVKNEDSGNVIHVHLSDIPDSPMVPKKE